MEQCVSIQKGISDLNHNLTLLTISNISFNLHDN